MKNFENREAAFASQNYDPNAVEFSGVPAHHVEALKATLNLWVAHDAVNPGFQPDYSDYNIDKFSAYHEVGSPSGAGFSFGGYDVRWSSSAAGARLDSESREACKHVAEICDVDYKAMKVYDRLAAESAK